MGVNVYLLMARQGFHRFHRKCRVIREGSGTYRSPNHGGYVASAFPTSSGQLLYGPYRYLSLAVGQGRK